MNKHLEKLLEYYALHQTGKEVDEEEQYVNDALKLIEIIKRLIEVEDTYYNPNFGSIGDKLYIDGCTEYLNEEEKELVKKYFGGDLKDGMSLS